MTEDARSLVKNAADAKQANYAARVEQRREQRREGFYSAAMLTPAGRFLLADIIVKSGIQKSPWNPHGSVQSANIGRMEVGLELDAYLKLVNRALHRQMWMEWDAIGDRDDRETDATHTAAAPKSAEGEA